MTMPIIRPYLFSMIESTLVQLQGTGLKVTTKIDIKESLPSLPKLSKERILEILTTKIDIALTDEQIMEMLQDQQAVEGLSIVAAILDSPELMAAYDVRLGVKKSQDEIKLEVSITRKIQFTDRTSDFSPPSEQTREVVEISVVTSEDRIKKRPRPKKNKEKGVPMDIGDIKMADEYLAGHARPDTTISQPCRPEDRICWQRQIRVFGSVPDMTACGEFFEEQESHEKENAGLIDHNLDKIPPLVRALSNPPPPVERPRNEDMIAAINLIAITLGSLGPNYSPPDIPEPPGHCVAEWNSDDLIPTLECTKAIIVYLHLTKDTMVKVSSFSILPKWSGFSFRPFGKLPVLSTYNEIKHAEAKERIRIYNSIWASRWLDRMQAKYKDGNIAYIERSLQQLSRSERPVLLARMRNWYNEEDMASYKPLMSLFFEEYFVYLYPAAAGQNGLPEFEKMPTRLWWATNWLSMVKRRGVSLEDALRVLRCTRNGEVALATLKGLIPYFKSTGRYKAFAEELEGLL